MASPMQDLTELTGGDLAFLVKVIGGPENVGRLKRGELKLTLEVVKQILPCNFLFDPAVFIGEGWSFWRGPKDGDGLNGEIEQDVRSLELKELDWVKVLFNNCLKHGEKSILGEEMLRRREASGQVRFGGNVFLSLWKNYQENQKNSVLEWLSTQGIKYIDFPGLILRGPVGGRYVLCLCRDGVGWSWSCRWLDDGWFAGRVSGVPAS